ncbi:MAG: hypothetical protein NXI32_31040, partial [bacterium]|nr:hypothetical protein [bacterium]
MWHELTQAARETGDLVVLGVIQEQHADRCRLFAQWQGFDWPILHDPVNQLRAQAVPYFVALDEAGVVVDADLKADEFDAFLRRPATDRAVAPVEPELPDIELLRTAARQSKSAEAWTALGDHHVLWDGEKPIDQAIAGYQRALELNPNYAPAEFGLGVAHRMRYDSSRAEAHDFQLAIDAWGRALALQPNQYIYRRRIQQYGPRLTKPYPFYDWVRQAQEEIRKRGDQPHPLSVVPSGAEIAEPIKELSANSRQDTPPDAAGRIHRDQGLIEFNAV